MMKKRGVFVIDSDILARRVVEPGRKAYQDIVRQFGTDILLSDGTLDRVKLGQIVFSDGEISFNSAHITSNCKKENKQSHSLPNIHRDDQRIVLGLDER